MYDTVQVAFRDEKVRKVNVRIGGVEDITAAVDGNGRGSAFHARQLTGIHLQYALSLTLKTSTIMSSNEGRLIKKG